MRTVMGFVVGVLLIMPSGAWAKIGGGDIVFRTAGTANVTFSHDGHVGKLGVKCKECHYGIYTTVEGHRSATMADMQKGKSCGACHNGKKAFAVTAQCDKCHQ